MISSGLEILSPPLLLLFFSYFLLFFSSLQNWLVDDLVLKMLEQGCLVQRLLVHMVTNRNSAVENGGDSEENVRRQVSLDRN